MTENAIPQDKGERLRAVRDKTGLTRLQFACKTGMSASTLKAVETGDRELSAMKALFYSNMFASILGKHDPEASFEYIFHGIKQENALPENLLGITSDGLHLQNEIDNFKKENFYSVLTISDDMMAPVYNQGDVVVGKKIAHYKEFPLYMGRVCIVETMNSTLTLRKIVGCSKRKIKCCVLNMSTKQSPQDIEVLEAFSIAQPIRHWHLSALVSSQSPEDANKK